MKYPINEHLRVRNSDLQSFNHDTCYIFIDDVPFVWSTDSHSIPIVWNNIVGCNMKSQLEHKNYIDTIIEIGGFHAGCLTFKLDNHCIRTFDFNISFV